MWIILSLVNNNFFFILVEKVTLITQAEAPDSIVTDAQATEVSFHV